MSEEKITKIPITRKERAYNQHGIGYVPCEISDRWLSFNENYDKATGLVFVDVMTTGLNGKDRRLCSLCLNINDLKQAIGKIIPK